MKNIIFWDSTPVALVRIDVSEGRIASIIKAIRIGELGTTLTVISNRSMLRMEALRSSETSVPTRATRCNIPEDGILLNKNVLLQMWFTH
jgi:hypothetical protein